MRTPSRSRTVRPSPSGSVLPLGLAAALALTLFGCSSGGGDTAGLSLRCGDGAPFCLVSCDLGCESGGCSVTEVAENQRLQFVFSQPINPASINGSTFSIRTTAGEAPFGDYLVDGNKVTFVPRIRVLNGVSSFGFRRNESYVLTLAGGPRAAQTVRSISGDKLSHETSCTMTATRGIIDEDNSPPIATLIAPTNRSAAPLDATFVIRFSEVIDASPFVGPLTSGSPILFFLRRARRDPVTNEQICELNSLPILLEGIPRVQLEQFEGKDVTTVSFKPNVQLPGQSCVEVRVTTDIRDLAGRAGLPAQFEVFTEAGTINDIRLEETFATPSRLDTMISGGTWQNGARPAVLGGDGRHGSFDPSIGTTIAPGDFEWDTDNFTIPGSRTLNGQPATVTDGKFYFTDFILPQGTTVRFKGSNPVQIFVRGRAEIRGRLLANAASTVAFRSKVANSSAVVQGQPGTVGGPGGGRGGQGGNSSNGLGTTVVAGVIQENGRPGEDVRLPAGHAYAAQAGATGGRGSELTPTSGLNTAITYTLNFVFSGMVSAGGGGGGYRAAGQGGVVNPLTGVTPGNPSVGGVAFPILPYPSSPPANYSSLLHFLVGGSGGGGGGTHPFGALSSSVDKWKAGGGGAGGGGAVAVRSGNQLTVGPTGLFEARGGSGNQINGDDPATPLNPDPVTAPNSWGVYAPGGGGSGGSVLLQTAADLTFDGTFDVRGGTGSFTGNISPVNFNVDARGGNGSNGYYRLESNGAIVVGSTQNFPVYNAAENQGPLNDRDDLAGCASLWRGTGLIFPPTWLRYELEVDLDGNGTVDNIYSDDPAVPNNLGPATDPLGPVRVQFQGARVNTTTNQPEENTAGPWRDAVNLNAGNNINADSPTGFRFQLIFNRRDFPNVVVRRLLVVARG